MLGQSHINGELGFPRNVAKGTELIQEAANLGDIQAHFLLATSYKEGSHGLKKKMDMALYHYEVAAMGGHFDARGRLGYVEAVEEKFDKALKHWMISARMGEEKSLKSILKLHKMGHATKDDYAQALCGYIKAKDEMSSNEREEARVLWR